MIFCTVSARADRPPNFIVILCDNLGYGDIEPFGSTVHRTPHLQQLAQSGRRFTHFYASAGVCTPSRASLLTGCYAQRVGLHDNPRDGHVLRPVSPYGLHPDEVTIAELLRPAGYASALIGKWHLGDQPPLLPTRQGFDYFFGCPYSDDMTQDVGRRVAPRFEGRRWPPLPLMENERVTEAPVDRNDLTQRLTAKAKTFIADHQDQPFFLLLSHAMPGSTAHPFASESFRGRSDNGPWGDAVEEIDWSTGEILALLRTLQIERDTLLIWTSDNGAPLARDPSQPTRGSNLPLAGRGYTTAEGAFRVPMIAWQPGQIPAGTTCGDLATTMDLLPTLAALAGIDHGANTIIDGRDIAPLLRGEPDAVTPHEAFFYYQRDQLQAVRSGRWKLFLPLETYERHPHFTEKPTVDPLLFDLVADVACTTDVAAENPDAVQRLTRLAERARDDLGDRGRRGTGQRSPGKVANPTPRVKE